MRTTLTLDDDNAVRLERLRKQKELSLKDAVNAAIRHGLDALDAPARSLTPFTTETFDPGIPLLSVDNVGDTLQMLEEHDIEPRRGA